MSYIDDLYKRLGITRKKPVPKKKVVVKKKAITSFNQGRRTYARQWWKFYRKNGFSHCAKVQPMVKVSGDKKYAEDLISRLWSYFIPTREAKDVWTSNLKEYKAHKKFRGDCDNYAITGVDVLLSMGAAYVENCSLHVVDSKGGSRANHMVGIVLIGKVYYLIDNLAKGELTLLSKTKYGLVKHMKLDNPGKWYKTI